MEVAGTELSCEEEGGDVVGSVVGVAWVVVGVAWMVEGMAWLLEGVACSVVGAGGSAAGVGVSVCFWGGWVWGSEGTGAGVEVEGEASGGGAELGGCTVDELGTVDRMRVGGPSPDPKGTYMYCVLVKQPYADNSTIVT